jgi:predicted Zn-dependent protease
MYQVRALNSLFIGTIVVGICVFQDADTASAQTDASQTDASQTEASQTESSQTESSQTEASNVQESSPEQAFVREAVTLFKANRIAECRTKLIQSRELYPAFPPADTFLAILFLSVGKTAPAMASLDQAIINTPEDPEAYVLLADLALKDGQRTVADLGYSKAETLLPGITEFENRYRALQIRTRAGMSSLAEMRGQFSKAEKLLKDWNAISPESPVVYGSLGRIFFRQKKYDEARDAFLTLSELETNSPPVEIVMGRLFGETGMKEESKLEMEKAAEMYPEDTRVRLAIVNWAILHGEMGALKANLDAAEALKPNSVEVGVMTARLRHLEGDLGAAEDAINAVVLKNPNSFPATNELARILANSDDEDKRRLALQYARRNYASLGKSKTQAGVDALITYAWALFKNKRGVDAEVILRSVPSGSEISAQDTYYSGCIYLERGQKAAAFSALNAALANESLFPERGACRDLVVEMTDK